MYEKKINRSELAKAIGIAPSTINAWYTKDYKGITLKNLSKLASFFDVSMEALVYGDRHSLTFTLDNYSEAELKAIHDFSQYIKESRSHE
jgi:DNA-binding Xre family transcriptional regulator